MKISSRLKKLVTLNEKKQKISYRTKRYNILYIVNFNYNLCFVNVSETSCKWRQVNMDGQRTVLNSGLRLHHSA